MERAVLSGWNVNVTRMGCIRPSSSPAFLVFRQHHQPPREGIFHNRAIAVRNEMLTRARDVPRVLKLTAMLCLNLVCFLLQRQVKVEGFDYDIAKTSHHCQGSFYSVNDIKLMASVTNNISHIRLLENQISLVSFYLEPLGNTLLKHFPLRTGDGASPRAINPFVLSSVLYRNAGWDEVRLKSSGFNSSYLTDFPCDLEQITYSFDSVWKQREQDFPASQAYCKHVVYSDAVVWGGRGDM